MNNEEKIIKKLEDHDKKFIEHDKRFDGVDKRLDKISNKLIEHDNRLNNIEENMATKKDLNRVINTLDEVLNITRRLDQERVFTQEWIRRIEREVTQNTRDIAKTKRILKIA